MHFVDTSVEVPVTPTPFPALTMSGGDRMLVIGKCFDQRTTFDISKPQGTTTTSACTGVTVLTPNIAVMTSPASPDGIKGLADFVAHSDDGVDQKQPERLDHEKGSSSHTNTGQQNKPPGNDTRGHSRTYR